METYHAVEYLLDTLSKKELTSLVIPTLIDDLSGKEALALLIKQHWNERYKDDPTEEISQVFGVVLNEAEVRCGLIFNTVSGRFEDGE